MISSVRWRILVTAWIVTGAVIYMGRVLTETTEERQALSQTLQQSFELSNTGWKYFAQRPAQVEIDRLAEAVEPLTEDSRRGAWRRFHLALVERSPFAVTKNRIEFAQEVEAEFRRVSQNRLEFLDHRETYTLICLMLLVFSVITIGVIYARRAIFIPLQTLSRRMNDFLNDRYTYQFSVPAPTEIGHLQATFNSLAQRVLRNMEDLTSLDHAKSEFLNIASHELRTPLTSIKGSLSLLKSGVTGPVNEMGANLLGIAQTETDRLIRLINELLDLAKIEAGKFTVTPEWKPIKGLADRTFASLEGLAQTANVQLYMHPLPPVTAYFDQDCIQQVLTNLLSNAIKFSPKGARVELKVDVTDKQALQFLVIDHGRGIAPEDQDLIFQKFRQATSVKNPLVKGTGLGLAIAKALVEQHQGDIGVKSSPGQGSTFYFSLPQWKYDRKLAQAPITHGAAA